MIVTDYMTALRDQLDDSLSVPKFTDAELIRHTDRQVRALSRWLVEKDEGYYNFTIALASANAAQLFTNCWQWTLPTWVQSIAKIYRMLAPTTPTNLSLYLLSSPVQLGLEIYYSQQGDNSFWSWDGNRTIRLWNESVCPNLALQVAKTPPPLFKGAMTRLPSAQNKLYMPGTLTLGTLDNEEGVYINAELQVTSTSNANALTLGDINRAIYSTPNATAGGTRVHELTFEQNWAATLAVGDIVESVVPFPDEHMRLLILRTAMAALQKKADVTGQKSLADDLAQETTRYTSAVKPRSGNKPASIRSRITPTLSTPQQNRQLDVFYDPMR